MPARVAAWRVVLGAWLWSAAGASGQGLPADAPLPPARPAEFGPAASAPPPQPAPPQAEPEACAVARARGAVLAPLRSAAPAQEEGCGVREGGSLLAVILPDGARVAMEPPADLRCDLAGAVAVWVREDVARLAREHGRSLQALTGVGGYACRNRNRGGGGANGGRLSEHATGAAFDVRGLRLAGGRALLLMDADPDTRALREALKASACARFATVLGAGSDSYHDDHLHVDARARRGGLRLCQWEVK